MSDALQADLIKLAFGFGLTTVLGGMLAALLQARLWRHQWQAQRTQQDSEAARLVFEDVSRIMDKRLYRLSQLRIWIDRGDPRRLARAIADYRDMLREWNDAINRNLSLLQFHFGTSIREQFDFGVGRDFVEAGALAESLYRALPARDPDQDQRLAARIESLRKQVYDFNLALLDALGRIRDRDQPAPFYRIFAARPADPA